MACPDRVYCLTSPVRQVIHSGTSNRMDSYALVGPTSGPEVIDGRCRGRLHPGCRVRAHGDPLLASRQQRSTAIRPPCVPDRSTGSSPDAGLPEYSALVADAVQDSADTVVVAQSLGAFAASWPVAGPGSKSGVGQRHVPHQVRRPVEWWEATGAIAHGLWQGRNPAATRTKDVC